MSSRRAGSSTSSATGATWPSATSTATTGPSTLADAAFYWASRVRRGQTSGRQLGATRYTESRYEDLVADPEAVTRRLCGFLDLEYEDGMMRYHERGAEFIAATRDPQAFGGLARPVTKGMRDWRTEMEPDDVLRFEAIAGDLLAELGYELTGVPVPASLKLDVARARLGGNGSASPPGSSRSPPGSGDGPARRAEPVQLEQPGSDLLGGERPAAVPARLAQRPAQPGVVDEPSQGGGGGGGILDRVQEPRLVVAEQVTERGDVAGDHRDAVQSIASAATRQNDSAREATQTMSTAA